MKIGKPFNKLSKEAYFKIIENHKKYTDFNSLGLYRSLIENGNITIEDRIEIRDFANGYFQKTFDFLQLKDPVTYFEVSTLDKVLTKGDEQNLWRIIRENQEKILKGKMIKHRNFGIYSRHNCGYEDCHYNGLMVKKDSFLAYGNMHFDSDHGNYHKKEKSHRQAKEQISFKQAKGYLDPTP